ncbi:hypothetical protein P692DRAFT_20838506 [Suillus brevipes Sb2]|nr:hypothetical protein P692DRAFT_20838506 [Suillus brevipes Sb2]
MSRFHRRPREFDAGDRGRPWSMVVVFAHARPRQTTTHCHWLKMWEDVVQRRLR